MTVDCKPDLASEIRRCRIVDAQIAMQLSRCPPPPEVVEAKRQTQAMIRACIARMQKASAP